jgi:hypothetical protein
MQLQDVAQNVCWWKSAPEALSDAKEFITQVMVHGTFEDITTTLQHFPESMFRDVLLDPLPGMFDQQSWDFWHARFGIYPPPPLPARKLS